MSASEATPPAGPARSSGLARWRPRPNPVLRRELVERWRGRRAFVVLTVHLGLLTAMMLLLVWAGSAWANNEFIRVMDPGPTLGRFLLENTLGLVLLLVLFVGPGYAAAQISQERERRTLGLLQITLVSPWRIVTGKLGAASAWLLLLVLLAAPMAAAAFFLGGVTVADLLRGVLYIAVVTVAVAAIGIGISSTVRRTVAAVVLTYGVVLLLIGGTVFGSIIELAFIARDGGGDERPLTILANPFLGLSDAVRASGQGDLPSILTPFSFALPAENRGDVVMMQRGFDAQAFPVEPDGGPLDQGLDAQLDQPVFDEGPDRKPVWVGLMALYTAMGALGLLVASRRVRPGHEPSGRRSRRSRPASPDQGAPPPPPPPMPGGRS